MVVLRNKGGTSMVFFRKRYATAIAKKPQKKVVFSLKLKILVYFGGPGPLGGRVWNQVGKRVCFRAKRATILEVILAPFRYFSGGIFECVFRRVPFLHFGRF